MLDSRQVEMPLSITGFSGIVKPVSSPGSQDLGKECFLCQWLGELSFVRNSTIPVNGKRLDPLGQARQRWS